MVGTSFKADERSSVISASGSSVPARRCSIAEDRVMHPSET